MFKNVFNIKLTFSINVCDVKLSKCINRYVNYGFVALSNYRILFLKNYKFPISTHSPPLHDNNLI